jgi:hypothetical protein
MAFAFAIINHVCNCFLGRFCCALRWLPVCYLATQSHARLKAPQGAKFSLSFLIVFSG